MLTKVIVVIILKCVCMKLLCCIPKTNIILYVNDISIKTKNTAVWYWHKDRHTDQQNRIENTEINTHPRTTDKHFKSI